MAKTTSVNLNSSTYTAISPVTVCRKVTVSEPNLAGTTDVYKAVPTATDSGKLVPGGVPIEFNAPAGKFFTPTDANGNVTVLGYLKLATGSVTFDQEEE